MSEKIVKGFKVFRPDWTCRGYQYKVGQTYQHEGKIEICESGFHFCQKANNCFNYYGFDSKNHVAEVEALGDVKTDGDKSVTNILRIVREIPWHELLDIVNEGHDCIGRGNTGDWNTGYWNTGDWNTGDWNKTNFSTGVFNTIQQPTYAFNKRLTITRDELYQHPGIRILINRYKNGWFIPTGDMTDDEKNAHPEYKTVGGYLETVDFQTAFRMTWDTLSSEERNAVRGIPNFDADIFEEITGIRVGEE